ncbi:MAG: type II/IV secretion system ATPase subunit [Candidatus Micrarchaeia archaeon]
MASMKRIETLVDRICEYAYEKGGAGIDEISKALGESESHIENIGKILSEYGVVSLIYPTNILSKPQIRVQQRLAWHTVEAPKGEVLEKYSVEANNVRGAVEIIKVSGEGRPFYHLASPVIGPYTEVFMNHLRDEIARLVPIETEEIIDQRKTGELKERFYTKASEVISQSIPKIEEKEKDVMAGILLHTMYGLGDIELLMADDYIEEIGINGSASPIAVYHKKYGWLKTTLPKLTESEIYNYASQIGRKSGREITLLEPIMDAHLVTGDRVCATLFPISTSGCTLTIRRFARAPWTITSFISSEIHTFSSEIAAFLWLCMQYEMNVLVVGGTASGKTSALNTLCALIPSHQRIVTIEDTRELNLPDYLRWNWVPLTTRNPNPEGKGQVSMLDLMVASLRMRPDRIIVGEIRRREEAEVLFEAMHTGHAVYSTMHADTAEQTLRRLINAPIQLPPQELVSLHLIVVQYRDRRRGIRRTYEISEVLSSGTEAVSLNRLYKWHPRGDSFEKMNRSIRIFDELNLHTGMSEQELAEDMQEKQMILEWMLRKKITDINSVGKVMATYYNNADAIVEMARKDEDFKGLV